MGAIGNKHGASDLERDSPGLVVTSDQTWKGVSGNLFLIQMC